MNRHLKQILTGFLKSFIGVFILLIIVGVIIPVFLSLFWGNDISEINDNDLMLPKVTLSDERNMFIELDKIDDDMIFEPKGVDFIDNFLKSDSWNEDFANDAFQKNEAALELWHEAAKKNEFQIPSLANPDEYSTDMPVVTMGRWRSINRISLAHAVWLAHLGKAQAAADGAMKSIKIGNAMIKSQNSLIGYLVGLSLKDKGLDALQKIFTLTKGQGINKYNILAELNKYKSGNENYSFFKGEYIVAKNLLENLQTLETDTATGLIPKTYSTNNFYFKSNMTLSYYANLQRQLIRNMQNPCVEPEDIDKPFNISTGSVWGIVKLYFTENAIGKMLTDLSFVALNSVITKTCDIQIKFQDTYNQINQY